MTRITVIVLALAAVFAAPALRAHEALMPHSHARFADSSEVAGWLVLGALVAALLCVLSLARFVRRRCRRNPQYP